MHQSYLWVKSRLKYLLEAAALATLYVAAARMGLRLAAVAGFATLVWPPTGIALAGLLIFGNRLWPAVAIGAVVANLLTGAPLLVALGIGVGNTLEALLGAYALRRIPGFRTSLDRLPDVLGLILLAAVVSTTVAATVGVASLYLGGIVAVAGAGEAWRAWWLGDLIGDLLVAPALLVWAKSWRLRHRPQRALEGAMLGLCILVVSELIFHRAPSATSFREAYLVFPLLIWAVLRFGQPGGVAAAFVISVIAVWGTVLGRGPFTHAELYQSLLALQIFMGVTAATFLVFGASVSERRRAIEELRTAIVEQRELHTAAAEASRAKSEFMAVMSHELRTPLNAIIGYQELLSDGIQGPVTDAQREYLIRIRRNGEHLLSLIDQVLGFARIEASQVSLDMQDVSVDATIGTVVALIGSELQKKSIVVKPFASDVSLKVRADPEKLRQILLNLLSNAIKFTDSGGVITVGADRQRQEPGETQGAGGMVRIWVRDTGIGIPPDQLERVLEPFVQADRGPTRRYPGVGLGLSIARDLALAMNGSLQLESAVGKGTTAMLALPAARV